MFTLLKTVGRARRAQLETSHGVVETPVFMPIATKGAVKTLSGSELESAGAQIILSNTYHLLLRPGQEALRKIGGLHRLMNWDRPILTDSGGYQVFSLSNLNKTTEEGVTFRSHLDGSKILLTPEGSMEMQEVIGSDLFMSFDDVAAGASSKKRFEEAMERSMRWAGRCREHFNRLAPSGSQLFGIVQGGIHEDLRERSVRGLLEIGFDGYAIGGLSVGEGREDAYRIAKVVCDRLPADRPRYFMGGGMPEEIIHYVSLGVDLFDCVLPTRNARRGTLFTWAADPASIPWRAYLVGDRPIRAEEIYQKMHVTNEQYTLDLSAPDVFCDCETCRTVSKAYLRHLFATREILGLRLATMHNVRFYLRLLEELRGAVA